MLGRVFSVLVLTAFIIGALCGRMQNICSSVISGSAEAVKLSVSLLGMMCLWSGIARTLDKAGLTRILAKIISPILKRLFPNAYANKSGINEIAADFSANLLGLGNAALPMGIRAMGALKNNGLPAAFTASNEMVLFAVINTAPFQLIPTTLIALRTANGSTAPFEIILPIWICSVLTLTFAVVITKILSKFFKT